VHEVLDSGPSHSACDAVFHGRLESYHKTETAPSYPRHGVMSSNKKRLTSWKFQVGMGLLFEECCTEVTFNRIQP
jgi:hypothetical protein